MRAAWAAPAGILVSALDAWRRYAAPIGGDQARGGRAALGGGTTAGDETPAMGNSARRGQWPQCYGWEGLVDVDVVPVVDLVGPWQDRVQARMRSLT